MDHKDTEERVERAEDAEDSKQQQQEVEQCNDAELYRGGLVQEEYSQVDSLRDCPFYCSSLYT